MSCFVARSKSARKSSSVCPGSCFVFTLSDGGSGFSFAMSITIPLELTTCYNFSAEGAGTAPVSVGQRTRLLMPVPPLGGPTFRTYQEGVVRPC